MKYLKFKYNNLINIFPSQGIVRRINFILFS